MKLMLAGLEARGEWERLPQEERDRRVGRHQQALQELVAERGMIGSESLVLTSVGLGPCSEATTLRIRDGRPLITDGPFVETKEVLAGFDLVDFASREAAVEFAAKRCTHEGHVTEIRPIREMWWAYHGPGNTDALKFMLMFVTDREKEARRSPADSNAVALQHQQVGMEYISQKGIVRGEAVAWCGARLHDSAEASTMRVSARKNLISDGPYAESKEVLGGFSLLDCASRKDVIEWAQKLATREGDTIEIRPVRSMWWIYHG